MKRYNDKIRCQKNFKFLRTYCLVPNTAMLRDSMASFFIEIDAAVRRGYGSHPFDFREIKFKSRFNRKVKTL